MGWLSFGKRRILTMIKKLILHSPKHYIAAAVIALALSTVAFFTRGGGAFVPFIIGDALSIGGMIVLFLGLLFMVAYFGAFDSFSYAFRNWTRVDARSDYLSFMNNRRDERRQGRLTFMPFIVTGLFFILAGALLML